MKLIFCTCLIDAFSQLILSGVDYRRFSIMPGARVEETARSSARGANRRLSIMPRAAVPTIMTRRSNHPLGFQDFDF